MKELIEKYLDKRCTTAEQALAVKYINTPEGIRILDEIADERWKENDQLPHSYNSDELYKKIESKINFIDKANKPDKNQNVLRYLAYAATFSLIALCTFLLVDKTTPEPIESSAPQQAIITKSTSRGQKSIILLNDGTKVILNSDSKITYARYFTNSSRTVTLEGEAFFEVAEDKTRPFEVINNNILTRALGTSFNINGRHGQCKVSLATGKVKVINKKLDNPPHLLEPGEALLYENNGTAPKLSTFNYEEDLLWKEGILYFKNTPFNEIKEKLELWYDVQLEIHNQSITSREYTGQFDNESLEHVLKNMSFSIGFKYSLKDKHVVIE